MIGLKEQLAAAEAKIASMDLFYESEEYRALPDENKRIFDKDRIMARQHVNMMRRLSDDSSRGID